MHAVLRARVIATKGDRVQRQCVHVVYFKDVRWRVHLLTAYHLDPLFQIFGLQFSLIVYAALSQEIIDSRGVGLDGTSVPN